MKTSYNVITKSFIFIYFFVGNMQLLQHYDTWRELIDSYNNRNAILEEDELSQVIGQNVILSEQNELFNTDDSDLDE